MRVGGAESGVFYVWGTARECESVVLRNLLGGCGVVSTLRAEVGVIRKGDFESLGGIGVTPLSVVVAGRVLAVACT